jgi:cysteine synthase
MRRSLGIDYGRFEADGGLGFDYEALLASPPFAFDEVAGIQRAAKVGGTPLWELSRLSELARQGAAPGRGARILVKDEAGNASGSFKARRACLAVRQAASLGYEGVIAATSGNYGAAVASQAAMQGLRAIVLQEVYDSAWRGQPEILEKTRACEAYGAEVWQLTVGPELFYWQLALLDETGFFNASLYTPYCILGIETLGHEIATQCREQYGRDPAAVLVTHAGGGNVTGTARGLRRAGATETTVIGVSVDLTGLHMASDRDFNRKSFTTGHTGFGVPFAVNPDRVDVPRNAARPLRYLQRYVTVTQGEVFFATELLAQLEGLERGPAGNTALAAALAIARELSTDELVVVQETEYTGAGKHPGAQLTFAQDMGIVVERGDPRRNVPGQRIVIPARIDQVAAVDVDLAELRRAYIRHLVRLHPEPKELDAEDVRYLAAETSLSAEAVEVYWSELHKSPQPQDADGFTAAVESV